MGQALLCKVVIRKEPVIENILKYLAIDKRFKISKNLTIVDPGAKPLNVQFINASTQAIHEHTVAQVYISPLRMLEFRAGVVVMLGH